MAKQKTPPEVILNDQDQPTEPTTPALAKLPPEPPPQHPLYAMLDRAMQSGRTTQELHDFMSFIERAERHNAEKEFNLAMAAAQAEMPVVVREAENKFLQTRYAKLEHVNAAIKPVYTRHGFALSFGEVPAVKPDHIAIVCDCTHRAGFVKQFRGEYPLDGAGKDGKSNKTGVQAVGSTNSYARRYLTLGIFNVTIADEDNDGAGYSPPLNDAQVRELLDFMAEIESERIPFDFVRFLRVFELRPLLDKRDQIDPAASLRPMRQSQFVEAVRGLRDKLKAQAEKGK